MLYSRSETLTAIAGLICGASDLIQIGGEQFNYGAKFCLHACPTRSVIRDGAIFGTKSKYNITVRGRKNSSVQLARAVLFDVDIPKPLALHFYLLARPQAYASRR